MLLKVVAFIYIIIMISTLIGIYSQTSYCMTQEYLRDIRGFGEGNGNPLQCSCLENPRNRGV